nr:MAG TPA: hypothetical protein [Caudoviricetes sp.]
MTLIKRRDENMTSKEKEILKTRFQHRWAEAITKQE